MDLKETAILGEKTGEHWYYRAKAKAMLQLLGADPHAAVLDVGAGSGFFSQYLLTHSAVQSAWCVDTGYAHHSDTTFANKPLHWRTSLEGLQASPDLVLLMDVLEHVDDDVGLLRACIDKVASGTRFLISVPAFQFLWSRHDVFLEHKRRYTLNQIEGVAERAGLDVQGGAYYFGLIFLPTAAVRLTQRFMKRQNQEAQSDLKISRPIVSRMLSAILDAELKVMKYNRIAGVTAFCTAYKR